MSNNILTNRIRNLAGIALATVIVSACSSGGDSTPVTPALTVSNAAVAEGNDGSSNLVFTLSLSSAAGSNASVACAITDITTNGSDYTAQPCTASFTAGALSTTITVAVTGDSDIEDDETLLLTLSAPSGVTMATLTATATGTISNDDNGGYFTGSVSLTAPVVTDPPTAPTEINDLQAIFNNDEFVIASVANDLLYKGTITSRTGTAYTATVQIYKDGVHVSEASVTGDFRSGLDIDGALSGTGDYTNGTFTLTYDSTLNTRAPLVFATDDEWSKPLPFVVILTFATNTTGSVNLLSTASSDNFDGCLITDTTLVSVNSEQTGRIRSFSGTFTTCTNTSLSHPANGTTGRGYFTSFDLNGTDNALLFILFNDNDAQISILDCKNNVCAP